MQDQHRCSSCPLSERDANKLVDSLNRIDERLQRLERALFAGRVALIVLAAIGATIGWLAEHTESIRAWLINWLKG